MNPDPGIPPKQDVPQEPESLPDSVTIFGMLRIKNESRWIVRVLRSILPLCERIFILDDCSTDGTPELCEKVSRRITVMRSEFHGLDESRDRQYLLERVMNCVSDVHLRGDERSPCWALAIDGDEVLDREGPAAIGKALADTKEHAFKLPVLYLWDTDMSLFDTPGQRQVRVDGVYRNFARPSLFRLFNRAFTFQPTPFSGNSHCSTIPQPLLHHARESIEIPLWHLGYNDKADRLRKFRRYNKLDPNNESEDCYRHIVQGDLSSVPEHQILKHAGPLRFAKM